MASWTKEQALAEIDALIAEIDALRQQPKNSAHHIRWLAKTHALLEEVFGRNSRYYVTFAALRWQEMGTIVFPSPWSMEETVNAKHQAAYLRDLEVALGLLQGARDHLERSGIEAVYEGKDTAPEASAIVRIQNLAERQLRKAIHDTPSTEKYIQNTFEGLLLGADIPYSREAESFEYSSKSYIPDFVFSKLDLATEVKFCAREGREREIIAEINDDILPYKTRYGNLFFIVYDVGQIQDVDRFAQQFEQHPNVIVRVVKH